MELSVPFWAVHEQRPIRPQHCGQMKWWGLYHVIIVCEIWAVHYWRQINFWQYKIFKESWNRDNTNHGHYKHTRLYEHIASSTIAVLVGGLWPIDTSTPSYTCISHAAHVRSTKWHEGDDGWVSMEWCRGAGDVAQRRTRGHCIYVARSRMIRLKLKISIWSKAKLRIIMTTTIDDYNVVHYEYSICGCNGGVE